MGKALEETTCLESWRWWRNDFCPIFDGDSSEKSIILDKTNVSNLLRRSQTEFGLDDFFRTNLLEATSGRSKTELYYDERLHGCRSTYQQIF